MEFRKFNDNIYEFIFPSELVKDEYDTYLTELDKIFKEKKKFCLLFNLSQLKKVTPIKIINIAVKDLNDRELEIGYYLEKSAICLTSDFTKKILKLFFKLKKPQKPNIVTNKHQDAYMYLNNTIN